MCQRRRGERREHPMRTVFVDTNVFLRFFTMDEADHHRRATALFRASAAGQLELVTGPPVLFEVAWTLRKAYGQTREKTLDVLGRIATLPGLRLTDHPLVSRAIQIARAASLEYADAYIAASAETVDGLATFNVSDFKKTGAVLDPITAE